jgi:molecular chaperone DnaK (HSP70)
LVAELTSEQLALLVEDELRKSLEVIEIALRSARIKSSQLHAVLLSGGGARLPLLADLVASCAVLRPVTMAAPEEMIARGAALLSTQS